MQKRLDFSELSNTYPVVFWNGIIFTFTFERDKNTPIVIKNTPLHCFENIDIIIIILIFDKREQDVHLDRPQTKEDLF